MNKLQTIFKQQEEFEHYLNKKVNQVDVPYDKPSHKHVIEAIYYFQCLNVEFYEFLSAETTEQIQDELIDVLIFAVDVFLFLGLKQNDIQYDLDYYIDKADDASMQVIKDSCYSNNLISLAFGKHKNIAEDFVTHILASLNIIFSKLLYQSVSYKKWKTYDLSKGVVKDKQQLLNAFDGVFLLLCTLFKALNVNADTIFESFSKKASINISRQHNNY